jgi:hypothetical protein
MFDSMADRPSSGHPGSPGRPTPARPVPAGPVPSRRRDPAALAALASLAERTRPLASSQSRLLPVLPPLARLLPDGALRRGTTLVVGAGSRQGAGGATDPAGERSLALALVSAASASGSWCALVGWADLGAEAAEDLGLDLTRLAVVPHPGPAWAEATAALMEGVDLVVLRPPVPPRPAMARRLAARARERRVVLIVVPGRAGWPEGADLHLRIAGAAWDGADAGRGPLRRRRMAVDASGRRQAVRAVCHHLWLPDADGAVRAAEAAGEGVAGGVGAVGA